VISDAHGETLTRDAAGRVEPGLIVVPMTQVECCRSDHLLNSAEMGVSMERHLIRWTGANPASSAMWVSRDALGGRTLGPVFHGLIS